MSELSEGYAAIAMITAIVFASRLGGYLLGSTVREGTRLRRLFDVLPGCAIAAVVAPMIVRAQPVEMVALAVASLLLWFTASIGLALASGLALLVAGAHIFGLG
ncbi:MAG: AzlD family protein [Minwuia sp.]|uniref:AzlD family protein n=1 Tax=Minwuia sp. TaxID=2493630 RepID=UPI003A83A6BF